MFKKILIAMAGLAISTSGFAWNGINFASMTPILGGLYVGMGISSDVSRLKNVQQANRDLGTYGSGGELLIGYGWNWYRFLYTGLEFFGQLSSNTGQIDGADRRQESSFGVRLIPGIKIANCTMLYGDVGYVRTRFVSDDTRLGRASNLNGFRLGTGIQTMIQPNVSLRGGWNINRFNTFSDGSGRLYTNQFYIDAIYHFMA